MQQLRKLITNLASIASVSGTRTAFAFAAAVLANLPAILRARTLAPADRAMGGRAWPYALQGVRLHLDGAHFAGAREMYCRQVYFPNAAFALRPGGWVVDLGANAGLFSLIAALAGCRVLAVEAQAGFVREIEALARTHGVREQITLEHALVGGASGVLSDVGNLQGASHFGGVVPPRVPMGDLLARHGIEEVDFLKMDIEGSEFDLVRSAPEWLRKVARLAMEVHPGYGDPKELVERVSSRGLRVELRDNDLAPVAELPAAGGYLFAIREPKG